MTTEELEQRRDAIASRAQVKRSMGDIEGAEADEQTVHVMSLDLARRRRLGMPAPTT